MRWLKQYLGAALVVLSMCALLPQEASAQRQHRVRSGDSLALIARRHNVRIFDLATANQLRRNSVLRPGDVLTIPPRGITYVQPGETLSEIARDHETTVDAIRRLNRIRGGLRAGQRLVLPGYRDVSDPPDRNYGEPDEPGLARIHRRDEATTVRLLDAERRVTREGLERLGQLMRRHDEDAVELPHPRLVHLLAAISDHFGGRQITLISGRREPRGYTRGSSKHVSGQATDIRIQGVSNRALWDFCRSLAQTGCGYYPRSTFVHVDVRERAMQWVDWSRPGRRPAPGNLRGAWRRACRRPGAAARSRNCAREGRRITREDAVPLVVELTEEARALMPVVPLLTPDDDSAPNETEENESPGES